MNDFVVIKIRDRPKILFFNYKTIRIEDNINIHLERLKIIFYGAYDD